MSDVKSKNLYELLGNTSDQDSDREPEPPTKTVDKPVARAGKRDAPTAAPVEAAPGSAPRGGRGGRRGGGFSGSEAAFRDRATGRNFNRDQPTGETEEGKPGRESGPGSRPRGRGRGGPRRGGDRHSRTGLSDHPKQGDQAWGQPTGEGELADEQAGDAIATEEIKEGGWDANAIPPPLEGETPAPAPAADLAEAEPEDNSISYADYVAEQAAKKLEGLGLKEARAPNEGSKENKKWKSAKELTKGEAEAEYFAGKEKSRREREHARNAKERLDIDYSFKEPARESRGGGRGRGDRGDRGDRGGRGRGDRGEFRGGESRGRGGRGDFEGRGRGRGRGEGGEGRGRGEGGEFRGRGRGRGGDTQGVAVNDESAFPSLGGK